MSIVNQLINKISGSYKVDNVLDLMHKRTNASTTKLYDFLASKGVNKQKIADFHAKIAEKSKTTSFSDDSEIMQKLKGAMKNHPDFPAMLALGKNAGTEGLKAAEKIAKSLNIIVEVKNRVIRLKMGDSVLAEMAQ